MSIDSAPLDGSPEVSSAAPTVVSAALASWPWRRAALFAGAAQLITFSVLVGADPIPATWSSLLLLAVAPAPVAAAAAFAPARINLLAAALVLAIPPPALARELRHDRLAWVFWHRPLTPERVLRDQPKPAT